MGAALEAARELVRLAKEQGLAMAGADRLLKQLTETVNEAALDEESTEHLGYGRDDTARRDTANSGNGVRDGTFEPKIVAKRQRRLASVDEMVLSLYVKGLTTGEISVADGLRSFAAHIGELAATGWEAFSRRPLPFDVVLQVHCLEYSVFGGTVQRAALVKLGTTGVTDAFGYCGCRKLRV